MRKVEFMACRQRPERNFCHDEIAAATAEERSGSVWLIDTDQGADLCRDSMVAMTAGPCSETTSISTGCWGTSGRGASTGG